MPSLARTLAVLACLVPLVVPAAAHADLGLTLVERTASETVGNGDDVVGPGDKIRVDVKLATATALSGATGKLMTATAGATLLATESDFTDAGAGGVTSNVAPFEVLLAADIACGANISFVVEVEDPDGEKGSVSFDVPTGTAGPLVARAGTGGALVDHGQSQTPLSTPGVTTMPLDVTDTGRIKDIEVRIPSLTHGRMADLRLELVAPDKATTLLAEAGTLDGTAMTDTVFADSGTPIADADSPYTGTFSPVVPFSKLVGRVLNGTWSLRITDTAAGETGTLGPWGLDTAKAYCSGIPRAAFSMTPTTVEPGGAVAFDGRLSSDSDGGQIVKYEWDLDGDGEFDDADTDQVPPRTYPVKGSYQIRLRVTDNDGLTGVHVRRLPVTVSPTAALTATPSDPLSGATFRLDAAGSDDPDGLIVRYQWDIDGDGAFERDTQGVDFVDASIARPGNVTVSVLVTDDDGAQAVEEASVTVGNRTPVAAIDEPGQILKGRPATLSASGSSDPDGAIVAYEWDLDGNGTYETDGDAEPTLEHTFTTGGERTIGVRVTDDFGATATATRVITVTHPPVVSVTATPDPVSLRRTVTFDASASSDPDDAAAVLTYEWDLDDDGTEAFGPAAPAVQTKSWSTAGTRTVKVRVTDESGAATVGSATVVVRNMTPVAELTATPTDPQVGAPTELSALGSSDPDGSIVAYRWDLDGDGSYEHATGTAPAATASFANAGNVTVGVRVTDDDGATGTKRLTIGVVSATGTTDGTTADGTPVQPAADGDAEPAPSGPGAADPAEDPLRPFGAWVEGPAIQRAKTVLRRGVLLSCRAEVAVSCRLRITVSARDARRLKLGRRAVKVASRRVAIAAGQTRSVRLKLSAKARRALRRTKSVRLLARAVALSEDDRKVVLRRVVLFRR